MTNHDASNDRRDTHDEFAELAAGYALDALTPDDERRFVAHLRSCTLCQSELVEFRKVTDTLALGVEWVEPPADLKARVIARATAQEQLSPTTASPYLTWLAAAAVALAIGLGFYARSLRSQVGALQQQVADSAMEAARLRSELVAAKLDSARFLRANEVLAAPNMVRVNLSGSRQANRASGRAFVSPGNGLVFSVEGMPVLPSNRVYQLWVIPPGANAPTLSAGVFDVSADGTGIVSLALPAGAQTVATVAVTVEPGPAGSPQATSPIILVGSAVQ